MAQKYGTEFSHLRTADWFVGYRKNDAPDIRISGSGGLLLRRE
jgi:hypothetical protein